MCVTVEPIVHRIVCKDGFESAVISHLESECDNADNGD